MSDQIRRLMPRQFKNVFSQKAPTSNIMVTKAIEAEVERVDNRTLRFALSTGDVDRDNDTIDPKGWQLDNFKKSPTMLWAHEPWTPPIAAPKDTRIDSGRLVSEARFINPDDFDADHPHLQFAGMVYEMYAKGFMHAVSVGFRPIKLFENTERGGFMPTDFVEQELLEYSAVPVPSNPNALMEAAKSGIDVDLIGRWALRRKEAAGGLWVPNTLLDELAKAADYSIEVRSDEPAAPAAPPDDMGTQPVTDEDDDEGEGEGDKGDEPEVTAAPDDEMIEVDLSDDEDDKAPGDGGGDDEPEDEDDEGDEDMPPAPEDMEDEPEGEGDEDEDEDEPDAAAADVAVQCDLDTALTKALLGLGQALDHVAGGGTLTTSQGVVLFTLRTTIENTIKAATPADPEPTDDMVDLAELVKGWEDQDNTKALGMDAESMNPNEIEEMVREAVEDAVMRATGRLPG